jgi:hypothetical protein
MLLLTGTSRRKKEVPQEIKSSWSMSFGFYLEEAVSRSVAYGRHFTYVIGSKFLLENFYYGPSILVRNVRDPAALLPVHIIHVFHQGRSISLRSRKTTCSRSICASQPKLFHSHSSLAHSSKCCQRRHRASLTNNKIPKRKSKQGAYHWCIKR